MKDCCNFSENISREISIQTLFIQTRDDNNGYSLPAAGRHVTIKIKIINT
jgi:hypothetical protein